MNGNCHVLFGAAVGSALAINVDKINSILPNINVSAETATIFVLGGILGGIFPDIDSPQSYVGKLTHPISRTIGKISKYFGKTKEMHRGIFHDPTIYLALLALSYFYFPPVIGFLLGCLSHLYLDLFNAAGIPIFLGARRIHIACIESGKKTARIFTRVHSLVAVIAGLVAKFAFVI